MTANPRLEINAHLAVVGTTSVRLDMVDIAAFEAADYAWFRVAGCIDELPERRLIFTADDVARARAAIEASPLFDRLDDFTYINVRNLAAWQDVALSPVGDRPFGASRRVQVRLIFAGGNILHIVNWEQVDAFSAMLAGKPR